MQSALLHVAGSQRYSGRVPMRRTLITCMSSFCSMDRAITFASVSEAITATHEDIHCAKNGGHKEIGRCIRLVRIDPSLERDPAALRWDTSAISNDGAGSPPL